MRRHGVEQEDSSRWRKSQARLLPQEGAYVPKTRDSSRWRRSQEGASDSESGRKTPAVGGEAEEGWQKTGETQEKQGSLCQWQTTTTWQTREPSQQTRSSRWRISRFSPQKKCSSRWRSCCQLKQPQSWSSQAQGQRWQSCTTRRRGGGLVYVLVYAFRRRASSRWRSCITSGVDASRWRRIRQ